MVSVVIASKDSSSERPIVKRTDSAAKHEAES